MDMSALSKQFAGSAGLFLRRHGPEILTAAGVAGFVASNYLTARAVLKSQKKIEQLKIKLEDENIRLTPASRSGKERRRAQGKIIIRDGLGIAKDFAPAIGVGAVSIFCVVAAHGMMQRKQTAIVAAYAAMEKGFRAYREKIQKELGPERELEIYRGIETTGPREGEEGFDPNLPCLAYGEKIPSMYARFFDESNLNWTKTPEWNKMFILQQQQWANDKLQANGVVYLNEVYQALGIERSEAGQVVGWRKNAAENGTGDGFISFGVFDIFDESSRAFVNGFETTILLDFNVDGRLIV